MDAESPDPAGAAVALEFPAVDSPSSVPRRIRRRLLEGRVGSGPASVEEIEAKLKEADLRRQQFHEWLASKARPRPRSPSWSSQEEDLGQRLEAKLNAAEQKRLSLLTKAQMRLAKLDELRQAAKTDVKVRYEKEREELGTRVESRVQQAEANRLRLLKDHMQRRAAAQERKARSLTQRTIRENKYKECVRSAIFQKWVAAEKKRLMLLEKEKSRVNARVMKVRRVAKTVRHRRESERRKLKEQLENKLQRARRQRAEYLSQRGSSHSPVQIIWNKHGDELCRKLARCWRRFVKLKKTTFSLATAYETLGINEEAAKSLPFEQLARRMESATTLQAVKALLDRLECRYLLSYDSSKQNPENIDHLLKRLASPVKRTPPSKVSRTRGATRKAQTTELRSSVSNKLSRYPTRVVLCAYMILGHPNAVFSGLGERELALKESAANFVKEFELLIKIILEGCSKEHSFNTFRSQLSAFDAAWRSYLYCFVVWKVKDARSLEDDLVKAACQLELSMMQTCKLTSEGQTCDLTHDMKAVQKQVTEDQKLLREKVLHLGGSPGIVRMESALSETRTKFFEAKDNETRLASPDVEASTSSATSSAIQRMDSESLDSTTGSNGKSSRVVRSLFSDAASPVNDGKSLQIVGAQLSSTNKKRPPTENEVMVNEIVHGGWSTSTTDKEVSTIEAKVKETIEKAFWDGIMDSLKDDSSNYNRIVELVKEVRDELCEMAPQSWKKEIVDSIDLDILSQLLDSGTQDTEYFGRILEYALVMVQKLSAPAKEAEMKKAHNELLNELASIARSSGKQNYFITVVKGLRFVLEEIQILKKEISRARIQMMEPIIKGSAGMEYLQKAFAERYGPPGTASLPMTKQWISSLGDSIEHEWNEHINSFSPPSSTQGLPIGTTMRTGGSNQPAKRVIFAPETSGDAEQPECNGERLDILLRVGLLKLASGIEGLTKDTVPETLELNFLRLRVVQSQLQQIIVVSTSMLVLRQILLSENLLSVPSSETETTISDTFENLFKLLDTKPDSGIEEIINTITGSSSDTKLQFRKELLAKMLTKSLQSNDAVFLKVSRAVYLAARALVLGGTGDKGRKQAEIVLRRIGAGMLVDRVVKAVEVLIVVAGVSGHVHGPWYRSLS